VPYFFLQMVPLSHLLECIYAVAFGLRLEEAAYDLSLEGHDRPKRVTRFRQDFSFFVRLYNRISIQEKNKGVTDDYEPLFVLKTHFSEAEEDDDPYWFCLRKLKNSLKAASQIPMSLSDCRTNLLQWVHSMVRNAVENSDDYTVSVPRQGGYTIQLDNHDISCFMAVVDLCRNKKEEERSKRMQLIANTTEELSL